MSEKINKLIMSLNAVDTGMIAALMALDPTTWKEITTPSMNMPVVVYDGDDEIEGVVSQIVFDSQTGEVAYGIDIGESEDVYCDGSMVDVTFDDLLPDHPYMFSTKSNVCAENDTEHLLPIDSMTPWLINGGVNIMSECGFRVFESTEFGIFFGCDRDDWEQCWELLYEALTTSESDDNELACGFCGCTNSNVASSTDNVGLLLCERCGKAYCADCLKAAVSKDAMNKMVWDGNTLLCPDCAKESGY